MAIEAPDVKKAIQEWLQGLAKTILTTAAVASILGGASWAVIRPFAQGVFMDWYDEASADLTEQVLGIAETNREILAYLARVDERNLLEFNGSPQVAPPFWTTPGDTIAIVYSLKRTVDCATDIEVNFISGALQRTDATLSYTVPAIRSRISEEFGIVVIDVRIPETIEPGWYSYSPVAVPINCDGYQPVRVPPSPFFEVRPNAD